MSIYTKRIISNSYYHIYNRGNNNERIFYNEDNHVYFLRKYNEYMSDFIRTYAFCLLPNHFHFLIKTSENSELVSEQFRKFFKTYAEKINWQTGRSGSLFLKPFKRKIITSDNYLKRMVFYVHYNPVHHKFSESFEDYKWSSYKRILNPQKTNLEKEEVLGMFGGTEDYVLFHKDLSNLKEINEFVIE
ncbi:MAG TPA: transposase [Ignavibacteria bacterium]|nr:transposase [Ignavibacteria bacterium]HMR39691.1 transposase [Ignavibacteria bacterium]